VTSQKPQNVRMTSSAGDTAGIVESAPSGFAGLVRARVAHLSLVAQSPQNKGLSSSGRGKCLLCFFALLNTSLSP
jgi:hypothetical protein